MTTSVANYQTAATVGPRFVVAGLLLGVLAWWMKVNHVEGTAAPTIPIVAIGCLAAVALLWGLMRLRVEGSDGAAHRHVQTSGVLAILAAIVCGAMGIWWAIVLRLDGLGETLGLIAFAIVALVLGMSWKNPSSTTDATWQQVRSLRSVIGIAFAAVGIAAIGGFLNWTVFAPAPGPEVEAPVVAAQFKADLIVMMIAGFTLFFGGLYLLMGNTASADGDSLRIFFLIVGSALGTLLTVESFVRWNGWKGDLTSAAAVAGENGWKFWIIAYGLAAGVVLTYGSCQLVVSMARDNPSMRQYLFGFAAFTVALLFLIFLLFANVMYTVKDPYTRNWTRRGYVTLSDSSKSLLGNLDKTVTAYVLMNPSGEEGEEVKLFLDNCTAFSNKLVVDWVNPETDREKYKDLRKRFPEIAPTRSQFEQFGMRGDSGRGILLVHGPLPDNPTVKVPHGWIPDTQLFESREQEKKVLFKGEPEVMKQIDFFAKEQKRPKIYFLQGDDEPSIGKGPPPRGQGVTLAGDGASALADKLRKKNFEVVALSFHPAPVDAKDKGATVYLGAETGDKAIDLPADCHTLVIVGASTAIPKPGLEAIERYMEDRGRMVVALDVFPDRAFVKFRETGLEDLLKKYGVNCPNEFLLRVPSRGDVDIYQQATINPTLMEAAVARNAKSSLAKQFLKSPLLVQLPRVVKPGSSTKFQAEPFLVVEPEPSFIVPERDPQIFLNLGRYVEGLARTGQYRKLVIREAAPIAVTVTDSASKPRMVVFGDAEFLTNEGVQTQDVAAEYALSSLEWLSESAYIGPSPKETPMYMLPRTADVRTMVLGSAWTVMVVIVMFGIGVWLVRRR